MTDIRTLAEEVILRHEAPHIAERYWPRTAKALAFEVLRLHAVLDKIKAEQAPEKGEIPGEW